MKTIGFTGTREGMTALQKENIFYKLDEFVSKCGINGIRIIHGDCVGSDADFDDIAKKLGIPRGIFPCNIQNMRAKCDLRGAKCIKEPMPPLERNKIIVDRSDIMFACPKDMKEGKVGGTWYTIRYTREIKKNLEIFWPSEIF